MNQDKNVTITVAGGTHSGKTSVIAIIVKALIEEGFKSVHLDTDTTGHAIAELISSQPIVKQEWQLTANINIKEILTPQSVPQEATSDVE